MKHYNHKFFFFFGNSINIAISWNVKHYSDCITRTSTPSTFEFIHEVRHKDKAHSYRLNLIMRKDYDNNILIFPLWRCVPTLAMASSFLMFLDYTEWRTTVGRTPLDEWSARRKDPYLTTNNTRNTQTNNPQQSKRVAADLCLWQRGQWNQLLKHKLSIYNNIYEEIICYVKKGKAKRSKLFSHENEVSRRLS